MGNELIEFSARFGGVARQISVPITNVYALYARETGHGMTFDIEGPKPALQAVAEAEPALPAKPPPALPAKPTAALPAPTIAKPPDKPSGGGKPPTLRRVK
jgi:stringent starvation protein B